MALDRGEVTLLALLDVSAAFDSVNHEILVKRLRISFGITGRAMDYMADFVYSRTKTVSRHRGTSVSLEACSDRCSAGFRFGSSPVLFTSDVPRILADLNLGVQQYGDDTQGYVFTVVRRMHLFPWVCSRTRS